MRRTTFKQLRKANGLTQAELASKAGVTNAYISMLESGAKGNPTVGIVRRLAKALNISVGELIGLLESREQKTAD